MKTILVNDRAVLLHGDAADLGEFLGENTVDAIVCDPPAGIGFMAKDWDKDKGGRDQWVAWLAETLAPAFAALKPGGHALVWALPKTSHWTALALELAGFEIRDRVSHLKGGGFPKGGNRPGGTGTCLKPACEDWWLARKPFKGSIKANREKWGTGVLWIDRTRIEGKRWPANLALDEEAAAMLDASVPASKSRKGKPRKGQSGDGYGMTHTGAEYEDEGGPSRFFYVSTPGRKEKDLGCHHLPTKSGAEATGRKEGQVGIQRPQAGANRGGNAHNFHPTVKSAALMRWLCNLITPPGGTVLDPFAGSGSTGVAALGEGFGFVGVEFTEEYLEILKARITHALGES